MNERRPPSRAPASDDAPGLAESSFLEGADRLLLHEEFATVSKRESVSGRLRVSTRTEIREEVAEVALDRDVVDVTRVPIGRVVEVAPTVRTEDGTVIVPVLEERYVVVKEIFLREELHIRRRIEHDVSRVPVELRRQVAIVERIDQQGHAVQEGDVTHPDPNHADDGVSRGESNGHS